MKMRLTNLLIVVLAVGGLAGGAYLLGSRVNDDANDALTPSLPAEVAAANANATLRPALFAANTYYVERSTYAGMTGDALRSYDQGLAEDLEVSSASATGFCIQIEVDSRTFSYASRNGVVAPGNGC